MLNADQSIVKKMEHDGVLKSSDYFAANTTQSYMTDRSNYASGRTFLM